MLVMVVGIQVGELIHTFKEKDRQKNSDYQKMRFDELGIPRLKEQE